MLFGYKMRCVFMCKRKIYYFIALINCAFVEITIECKKLEMSLKREQMNTYFILLWKLLQLLTNVNNLIVIL